MIRIPVQCTLLLSECTQLRHTCMQCGLNGSVSTFRYLFWSAENPLQSPLQSREPDSHESKTFFIVYTAYAVE